MADSKRAKASQSVNPRIRKQTGFSEDDEYGYQPASGSRQANRDVRDADDLEREAKELDSSPFGYYGAQNRRYQARSLRATGKIPETYVNSEVRRAKASRGR